MRCWSNRFSELVIQAHYCNKTFFNIFWMLAWWILQYTCSDFFFCHLYHWAAKRTSSYKKPLCWILINRVKRKNYFNKLWRVYNETSVPLKCEFLQEKTAVFSTSWALVLTWGSECLYKESVSSLLRSWQLDLHITHRKRYHSLFCNLQKHPLLNPV